MRQLKQLSLLLGLLLLGPSAYAQSVRFQSQAISTRGAGIANATVAVCTQPANTNTQPCSPLATLATSTITTSGGANPLTADSFGNFFFYAAPGRYTVQIYGLAVSGQFVTPDVEVSSTAGGTAGAFSDFISKNTPVVDVRAFASLNPNQTICDGIHNDTPAFQAAAVQANGGQVLGSGGGSDSGAKVFISALNGTPSAPTVCLVNALGLRDVNLEGSSRDSVFIKPFAAPVLPLTISSISRAANVVTVNTSTSILGGISNLFTNGTVVIAGVTGGATSFNGTFIVASTPSATQFTYSQTGGNESGSGGKAGMSYLLDGHLERDGVTATPAAIPARFSARNLTIDCTSFPTWGGIRAWAGEQDFNDARLLIRNCAEGLTSSAPTASTFSDIHAIGGVQGLYFQTQSNGTPIPTLHVNNVWCDTQSAYGCHFGGMTNSILTEISAQNTSGTTTTPNIPCSNILMEGNQNGNSISIGNQIITSDSENSGTCVPFYLLKQRDLVFSPGTIIIPGANVNFVEANDVTGTFFNVRSSSAPGGGKFVINSTNNSSGSNGTIKVFGGTVTVNSNNDFQFYGTFVNGTLTTMIPSITLGQGLGSGFPILNRGFNTLIVNDGTGGNGSTVQAGVLASLANIASTETTAPSAAAGQDICYGDSTAHTLKCSYNNGTFFNQTQTIGTGNVTTAGTAINTLTCQAQTGITVTGAATSDNVIANIGAALPATWQTGITMQAHVTATNTVTVYLCNPTATATITPAATQVNVRVVR